MVCGEQDTYGRPVNLRTLPLADQYLLSPKDLATYTHLAELVDAPIVSLKIEGRMRSPEYVAIVTATYREALDAIARGTWKPDDEKVRDLLLAFNRGFTAGYLFCERHGKLMSREQPSNRGLPVGVVTNWDDRSHRVTVTNNLKIPLHSGDGVLFSQLPNTEAEWGFSLNNEPVFSDKRITFAVPRAVQPGARLSLTSSAALSARARQITSSSIAGLRHPVPVDLEVRVNPDGTLLLEGTIDIPGKVPVRISRIPDIRLVTAKTHPLTREQLESQLTKTGGTPFVVRELSLTYDGCLFAPLGELNRVRRDFFLDAEEQLINATIPASEDLKSVKERLGAATGRLQQKSSLPTTTPAQLPQLAIYVDQPEQVKAATRSGVDIVYFEPDYASGLTGCNPLDRPEIVVAQIREALECCLNTHVRLVWKLPRITGEAVLQDYLPFVSAMHKTGLEECMVGNVGTARAIHAKEPGMHISGSVGLNVFNSQTVRSLSSLQFSLLTLSPELSGTEIVLFAQATNGESCTPALAVIVQGSCEAMISRDCLLEPACHCRHVPGSQDNAKKPFFGIQDETGHIFPFSIDGECRTHLANAVETCLIDALPELIQSGIRSIAIDARGRTAAYAGEMVQYYREAITISCPKTRDTPRELERLKERIKGIALGGITAGHYRKGLKEE
jgi:putative protease